MYSSLIYILLLFLKKEYINEIVNLWRKKVQSQIKVSKKQEIYLLSWQENHKGNNKQEITISEI